MLPIGYIVRYSVAGVIFYLSLCIFIYNRCFFFLFFFLVLYSVHAIKMINNQAYTRIHHGISCFCWCITTLIFHAPKHNSSIHLFKSNCYLWYIKQIWVFISLHISCFCFYFSGSVFVSLFMGTFRQCIWLFVFGFVSSKFNTSLQHFNLMIKNSFEFFWK